MDRPWQLCMAYTNRFSKLKLLCWSLKYLMETSSCVENPYWGCKYFFDTGFFFFFLSEYCNEQSASFKILLLFFFSDDDSLFIYDCSAAEKKSQEHKGWDGAEASSGWLIVSVMGLFSLRSKLLFYLLNSSFLLPICVDKPDTTSREKCAIDFQTRHWEYENF